MKSTVLLIDYTNLHVKCTQNLLFAKWAKPKLRFWRIFQTGACYMIPLQTRVAHTFTMLISVFWTNSANVQGVLQLFGEHFFKQLQPSLVKCFFTKLMSTSVYVTALHTFLTFTYIFNVMFPLIYATKEITCIKKIPLFSHIKHNIS